MLHFKRRLSVFAAVLVLFFLLAAALFSDRISSFASDSFGKTGTAQTLEELRVKVSCSGFYQTIQIYSPKNDNTEGEAYVFLPAGAKLNTLSFYYDDISAALSVNGKNLPSGKERTGLKPGDDCTLVFEGKDGRRELPLVIMQSENLPAMFIDTQSGILDDLLDDQLYKEAGQLLLVRPNGKLDYKGDLAYITGRGNSTWTLSHPGWRIALTEDKSLLDMAPADSWILLANAKDETCGIRNMAAYSMAAEAGLAYTSRLAFVDLYLNGDYQGCYQLAEKITESDRMPIGDLEAANKLVNPELVTLPGEEAFEPALITEYYPKPDGTPLANEEEEDTYLKCTYSPLQEPEDISGGYILERNTGYKLAKRSYRIVTAGNERFGIRYPSHVTEAESAYLLEVMQHVENALAAEDGIDPETGLYYTELIDVESWAKKYLVDEITKNEGAGATSCYFYLKQGDSRLYAGPIWDYDKSLGAYGDWITPNGLTYCSLQWTCGEWWSNLYEKEDFRELLLSNYTEIFRPYIQKLTDEKLAEWQQLVTASDAMTRKRWGYKDVYDTQPPIETQDHLGDFGYGVNYLRSWLQSRTEYLDSVWLREETWYRVDLNYEEFYGTEFAFDYFPSGASAAEMLTQAAGFGSRINKEADIIGWTLDGSAYDVNSPVTQDIKLSPVWSR